MIISEIRTTILRLPTVYINGDGLQDILIIEVITDEGLIGIGEAHTMPTALKSIIDAPVSQFAVQGLSLLLVGQDPSDIAGLWQRMWRHCGSVLGGRGLVLHAMSGIDLALWDLKGKIENKPLCQLLGTVRRDKVDVYASDLMPSTADALVARALELKEKGYRFLKFGWGKIGMTPSEDIDILARVREEIGSDMGLMIDVGVPIPYKDAVWLARNLEPLGVEFLEEPLDATDFEGYSALVSESPVPIAAGEREGGKQGFSDLITRAHLPIVQPDLARCGGITVAKEIADLAASKGAWVVPHCWSSDILVAATAHFLASLEQRSLLEFNVMDQPLRTNLILEPFVALGGAVSVPRGPGLGIELNPETIEKFRVI